MMSWLLKYEGYPSGVVGAILVHALLIYIVLPKNWDPADMVKIQPPSYISATVAKDNPQRLRQLQELERQRQQEADKQRRNREQAKAAEEKQKREQAAKLEADKKLAEQKKEAEAQAQRERDRTAAAEKEKQAADDARKKQEQAQRETERQRVAQEQAAREAAEKEAANQAAAQAQALSAENQLVAQYMTIIREIVEARWVQPPNSRNGMQVLINIKLAGSGEIISSVIIQSSGDPVFDRAALQAVDKSARFPELIDLPPAVFQRNFRDFNLLFSPEDLLR